MPATQGSPITTTGKIMPLANEVVVITGASSGLGWAMAEELARRGCRLGLIARRRELLDQLADKLRATGAIAEVAAADVTNREELLKAFGTLRTKLGPVDVLIANAGVVLDSSPDVPDFPKQLDLFRVNLFGVVIAIEAVLPEMLQRRKGHIAAVSSQAAFKGLPGAGAYCASKAAVNTYLEALRIQVRKRGIKVTTLCPGFVRTPMVEGQPHPMPFIWEPDRAARKMIDAIERGKKVCRFPLPITMLLTLARWLPDRIIARRVR